MQILILRVQDLCQDILQDEKRSLERAEKYLNTIVLGYPQQSVIYYGSTWCRKDGVVKCDRM